MKLNELLKYIVSNRLSLFTKTDKWDSEKLITTKVWCKNPVRALICTWFWTEGFG